MFAQGVKNIPYDLNVICVGSEGVHSKRMVEHYGFTYIEKPNRPLSNKMNASVEAAKGSDYVICVGSDDILSPELFELYLGAMKQDYDFIGLQDLYFYDLRSGKALYWGGYSDKRKGKTVGAGRCISKRVLDSLDWQLWEKGHNRYLDSVMRAKPINEKVINLKKENVLAVDIKSGVNITHFEKWQNAQYIDPSIITNKFEYIKLA